MAGLLRSNFLTGMKKTASYAKKVKYTAPILKNVAGICTTISIPILRLKSFPT